MKKWILVLFFANFLTLSALADIYIEPSLGYNIGSYTTKLQGAPEVPGSLGGVGLGLKAGYSIATFFGGLDVQYNMLSSSPDDNSGDSKNNNTMVGISAGVDLILVRAWAGYYFSNTFDFDTVPNEMSGTAFKIGAGYKIIPMVSLNAEYIMGTFDEIEPATTPAFEEATGNTFLISVSVPLSI